MKKKILSLVLALCMVLMSLPLPITANAVDTATYDLAQGSVTIDDNSPENITINQNIYITANTIQITGTKNHTVTLNGLQILSTNATSNPVAVDSSGTTTLTLSNINTFNFEVSSQMAAVRKTTQGTLIIAGSGTLSATGGYYNSDHSGGAAIGGNDGESTANIIIQSGTIQATSLSCAAAIGGGNMGSATNIQITGGNVSTDSEYGAAIGGGGNYLTGGVTTYTGRNIVISGGTVKANTHDMNKCMAIGDGNVGSSDGYGMDTNCWGNILQPPTGMVSKVEYTDNGTQTSFNGNYGTDQKADITRFGSMQISFVTGFRLTVQNGTGSGLYLTGKPVNISFDNTGYNDPGYIEFSRWTLTSGSAGIADTTSKSTTLTMGNTDVTVTVVKAINYDSLKFVLSPVAIKGESGKTQQFAVSPEYNGTVLTAEQMAGLSYTTTWSLTGAAYSTISSTGLLAMGNETENIKVNAAIYAGGKTYTAAADVLYKEVDAGGLTVSGGLLGLDYTYADNVLTFTGSGTYLVGMKPGVTTSATRIVVNGGSPKITLQNVNISAYINANSIFCVRTGSPTVTISGENSLINTNPNDGSNGLSVMNGQSLTLDGEDSDTLTAIGSYFSVVVSQGGFLTIKGGHYSFGKSSGNVGIVKVDYYATCVILGGIIELQEAWTGRDCNVISALGDFRIIPAEGRQAAYTVRDSTKYLTEPYSTGTVIGYYTKISFSDSLPVITAALTGAAEDTSAGITVNGTSSSMGYYRLYEGGVSSTPLASDIMGSSTGTVGLSKDVASSVSLTGLKEGTTYDCCIVAVAGSGESKQVSKVVKVRFTTLLAAPSDGDTLIDYTGEYLKDADTLASGTTLQYANTENAAAWIDFPTDGVSLTSLLDSQTGTDNITLYVRKKSGEAYSAAAAVSIPTRPSCSVSSLDISYANETVTVPTGLVYQFSVQSPSSWSSAAAGTGSAVTLCSYISAAGTPENAWNKIFFRSPATANSFASKIASIEIPARPAATAPTMSAGGLTFASITLNPTPDTEYKLTKINGNTVENAQYQASNVFSNLNPTTKYTFAQCFRAVEKTAGADGHFASEESAQAEFTTAEFTALYNGSAEKVVWYANSVQISAMGYTVSDAENGIFLDSYTISETCINKALFFKNESGAIAPFAISVKVDKTAPTGKIIFGSSWWDRLLSAISFGFYHVNSNAVTIESSDGESGIKATQYLIAAEGTTYTQEQLAAKADGWQDYNPDSKPALTEGQKSVVYTKITNNAGHVTYLCSDGMILDNTAPTNITIAFRQNPFKTVAHFVTFGLFFGDTTDVNFTADDLNGVDHYEYQTVVEGGTFDPSAAWKTGSLSIQSDFKGIIYARAADKAGNLSGIASKSFVVDKTAPVITANLGNSTLITLDTNASIPFVIKDGGAGVGTVTYQVNGGSVKTIDLTGDSYSDLTKEYSFSIGSLPDGTYDVVVNATDNSGNAATTTTVHVTKNAAQTGFGFAYALLSKTYGDVPFIVAATGGQGEGTVTYAVTSGEDVLSVDASTGKVTIQKVGNAVITAIKVAGNGYIGTTAQLTVNVSKAEPTVQVIPTASDIAVIGKLSSIQLTGGKAIVQGTFCWTNPDTVVSSSGRYSVTFTPKDADNYNTVICNVPVTVSPILTGNGFDALQLDCSDAAMPSGVTSVSLTSDIQSSADTTYSVVKKLIGQDKNLGDLSGLTVYDLKLLDQDGNPIEHFTGKIKVKIPIPSGMSGKLKVYWYDPAKDTLIDMNATQENGYLLFETSHFSFYAISQLNTPPVSNPKTGTGNWPIIPLALLGGGAILGTMIVKQRRFLRKKKQA